MFCKKCDIELTETNTYEKDKRFCTSCGREHTDFLADRRETLKSLREMPFKMKVLRSQQLITQAVNKYGIENVYISYSGGKDSTVLSHIAKSMYPNILHIFSNTTNEYPETIKHVHWERDFNGTNLIIVLPYDSKGVLWTFKKVVEEYGYPMFSKRVACAIRTYQHALSEKTKKNSLDYMNRNFKKYMKYLDLPISDKCCDKLKKEPLRRKAKELGMKCSILGILASESYQREKDWLEYGCNVFEERKDNQSRPLSFWTNADIDQYISEYNVRISDLYSMGYSRNGCMYCGFGVQHECNGNNRYQKLKKTHPAQYQYFVANFSALMVSFQIEF